MSSTLAARDDSIRLMPPDIRLVLDHAGIIREVALSDAMPANDLEGWIGTEWSDTVDSPEQQTVATILERAVQGAPAVSCEVSQRFPDGRKLPIEYTAISGDRGDVIVAIGKNMQAIHELEDRMLEAQRESANDHIKLRETETRYQLLLEASTDAILLLDPSGKHVVEANLVALRALGLEDASRDRHRRIDLYGRLEPNERKALKAMLDVVREQSTAPGILLHIGPNQSPWFVRAALTTTSMQTSFLLRLSPAETAPATDGQRPSPRKIEPALSNLLDNWPHAFVLIDAEGRICYANNAFLDIVQLGSTSMVIGKNLGRWLNQPGANLKTLLGEVDSNQSIRSVPTVVHSDLGLETEVEFSASMLGAGDAIGVMLADVSRRIVRPHEEVTDIGALMPDTLGNRTLRQVTRDAVAMIERQIIRSALRAAGDNRTAAAESLGLSRQSLYAKLSRYDLIEDSPVR
jgi:transcriptional regulator PpsR